MKKIIALLIILSTLTNGNAQLSAVGSGTPSSGSPRGASAGLRGAGLCFTPNKGQVADMNGKLCPDVLYKGSGAGADIYLRKNGISYVHTNMAEVMKQVENQMEELEKAGITDQLNASEKKQELMHKQKLKIHRVDMDFEGANTNCDLVNNDEVEGYTNYYYAHCPQGVTNVKQYNKVTYKNIYNNIDVTYYASTSLSTSGDKENGVKYDLIVQPHGDPNQIKLHWKGAKELIIKDEKLIIRTSVNEFYESIPKVYQNINGNIVDVKTKYILTPIANGEAIINFSFLIYNSSFPFITVLMFIYNVL